MEIISVKNKTVNSVQYLQIHLFTDFSLEPNQVKVQG